MIIIHSAKIYKVLDTIKDRNKKGGRNDNAIRPRPICPFTVIFADTLALYQPRHIERKIEQFILSNLQVLGVNKITVLYSRRELCSKSI